MINRDDMLELTRRMTLSRTSFTRIAGCYVDRDGEFDGSFNINFLKLSASERTMKLKLAKEIPFAATNVNLKKYEYPQSARKPGSMWQLLMAMNECGLKNDALMDTYPPGSTFKMVTAIAGLEEGIITPSTQIKDLGAYN